MANTVKTVKTTIRKTAAAGSKPLAQVRFWEGQSAQLARERVLAPGAREPIAVDIRLRRRAWCADA